MDREAGSPAFVSEIVNTPVIFDSLQNFPGSAVQFSDVAEDSKQRICDFLVATSLGNKLPSVIHGIRKLNGCKICFFPRLPVKFTKRVLSGVGPRIGDGH